MQRKFIRICFNKSFLNAYTLFVNGTAKASTCSRQILKHFSNNGQLSNLDLFPSELKVSTSKDKKIYVADKYAAEKIANTILRLRVTNVPFFEINPGPCFLTNSLLNHTNPGKLELIEENEEFMDIQKKLAQSYPSNISLNRIKYRWSYYTSIANIIRKHSKKQEWNKEISSQLFMHLQRDDIYRIVDDLVKQRRFFANGRIDIFAILPSVEYMRLTSNPHSGYMLYTHRSCIFQILFESELLAEFQRESFLPWLNSKPAYGGKLEYDRDLYYLVKIVPRRDLFSMCQPENLPLLRFFVNQCLFKRTAYIIAKLEQWIPGIGVDLITSKFKESSYNESDSTNLMHHLENKFHVFTDCGSLKPLQMCALFQFLQKSPHYDTSPIHQQCREFNRKIAQLASKKEPANDGDEID